jgi:hypothetical protein
MELDVPEDFLHAPLYVTAARTSSLTPVRTWLGSLRTNRLSLADSLSLPTSNLGSFAIGSCLEAAFASCSLRGGARKGLNGTAEETRRLK